MRLRALVADDHSIVVAGLKHILQQIGIEVLKTVENGRDLVSATETLKPDIVILDISMPVLNGVEAARQIRAHDSRVKLLFLSMHSDAAYVRESFQAGGNGYLLKGNAAIELAPAIRQVMDGRKYVSQRVLENIGSFIIEPALESFGSELSQRQREVLQLAAEGRAAKEIANVLHISVKTVEYHKANIMSTLGLRNNAELVAYAIRHKIISG
jgi:DNA-binding NarL/FixJ family response regulator